MPRIRIVFAKKESSFGVVTDRSVRSAPGPGNERSEVKSPRGDASLRDTLSPEAGGEPPIQE